MTDVATAAPEAASRALEPVEPIAPAKPAEPVGSDQREMMERLAEKLDDYMRERGRQLEFQVANESNRVVILVKSADSGEVLRSIPPDEARRLADLDSGESAGVLIDQRA